MPRDACRATAWKPSDQSTIKQASCVLITWLAPSRIFDVGRPVQLTRARGIQVPEGSGMATNPLAQCAKH